MPLLHYHKKKKGKESLPGSIGIVFLQDMTEDSAGLERKEVPQCTRLSGVFTLEAAVVLPLLVCFFVTILFFFRVMQIQLVVQGALNHTGRLLSVYAAGEQEDNLSENLGIPIAAALIAGELKEETVVEQYVSGGIYGISLWKSSFEGENIELTAECLVKLPVELLGKRSVRLVWHTVCRKWTGWYADTDTEQEDSDIWVYVTETGQVYHRQSSCTYLALSITKTSCENVGALRNENGEKYYECQLCADKKTGSANIYITKQGNRYHYDLNCSGIKRTVRMIRLSEAGSRSPCSRCGGTQKEGT